MSTLNVSADHDPMTFAPLDNIPAPIEPTNVVNSTPSSGDDRPSRKHKKTASFALDADVVDEHASEAEEVHASRDDRMVLP